MERPVLIVSFDPNLFGAMDGAREDINRYVARIISGRYTPERMREVTDFLDQNPQISTIITRGVWYNKLLELEYIRMRPHIRVAQMVFDTRVCLSALNEMSRRGFKRIGRVSINSPYGDDPPTIQKMTIIGGMVLYNVVIKDTNESLAYARPLVLEKHVDVLWGDVLELEDEVFAGVPKIAFGVRGKALSAMLRHAGDYAKAQSYRLKSEKLMGFLSTMAQIVSEGILMFNDKGVIVACNNNFVISRLHRPQLEGLLVQDVVNMPLKDILALSVNTLMRIEGHNYIANLLQMHAAPAEQYALILTSTGQISTFDLSARTQMTKDKFPAKYSLNDIIAVSAASRQTVETAKAYAQHDETVLITGDTGTGKELYASSIHRESVRQNRPFVAINCATLSASLIDSELFGYEKGSFTGALSGGKKGLFELAHQGTIFLDEISEMPLQLQAKLLRVLQEKNLMRIGGSEVIPIDVRVIAATNKNLLEQCEKGNFRYDLYYRLALLELYLRPLKERREDIVPLFVYFLKKNMLRSGRKIYWDSEHIFHCLCHRQWKGNIRELENAALRTIILARELKLTAQDVERALSPSGPPCAAEVQEPIFSTKITADLNALEREYIAHLMRLMNNDRDAVCNYLNISKPTLWRKLNYQPTHVQGPMGV